MTDVHALSGAYAVDALDDLERAAFERHLVECAECRAEVASLRETAALIAETTAVAPPPELRDRVLAGIATVRPLPPQTPAATVRRHRPRLLLAAAAAVVLVGAGGIVWQEPWADDTSQQVSAVDAVLTAPDAGKASEEFPGGASATVTYSNSLGKAVIETHDMPPPPEGKVYQIWFDQPGKGMVSAGVMPVVADLTLLLAGDASTATAAGITVEPEGGSEEPTTTPIALFEFAGQDA